MTLKEGRNNFFKFGAHDEQFIKDVVKNPETIFKKENQPTH